MNLKISLLTVLFAGGIILTNSCKKEEIPAPEVSITELGYQNNKTGYVGSDLHIEADIVAEGVINTVKVEIHSEGFTGWEFEKTFDDFSGLKNTVFHKHIEIPLSADTGDYHFHLIVTDKNGKQTVVESELKIRQPEDTILPVITVNLAPANGQAFNNGETITIMGTVTDNAALGGIYIGLVRDDQNLTDEQVNSTNTITLLHFHDFPNPASYYFTGSIAVGSANDNDITPKPVTWTPGNYYILVKCKDAFGGNWSFSAHYPIVIN